MNFLMEGYYMGITQATESGTSSLDGSQSQSTRIGVISSMDTVLIVEDSRPMQRTLQRLFESDSLQVQIASDGPTGLEFFRKQLPCIVVLDLKLPGISGKELCREFKSIASSVPIVVLSANSEVEDKVLLLELGADDYVTKPFSPKELLARVRRAMRRTGAPQPTVSEVPSKHVSHEVLTFGDARIDFTSMEAARAGKTVTLTTQEFKLLKYLAASAGRVISREELLNEVWGYQNYPSTRTVDNHILRLRQKLEPDPACPRFLLTMHGAGYKFILGSSAT
jgi:DNA-binding response OmpR family regulator